MCSVRGRPPQRTIIIQYNPMSPYTPYVALLFAWCAGVLFRGGGGDYSRPRYGPCSRPTGLQICRSQALTLQNSRTPTPKASYPQLPTQNPCNPNLASHSSICPPPPLHSCSGPSSTSPYTWMSRSFKGLPSSYFSGKGS